MTLLKDQAISHTLTQIDHTELTEAIYTQKPMVLNTLRERGALDDVDEVMSDIADQMMRSLPRYEKNGTVPLAQWATGVAKNVLAEHQRRTGRAKARYVPYEEAFAHAVTTFDPIEDTPDFLTQLVLQVRDAITSHNGGIQEWQRLVTMATKPERGRAARETIREHMARISGLPVTVFGTEEPEPEPLDHETPVPPVPAITVTTLMLAGTYRIQCTACGLLPDAHVNILDAASAAQTHESSH